jgi:hypothetical protein
MASVEKFSNSSTNGCECDCAPQQNITNLLILGTALAGMAAFVASRYNTNDKTEDASSNPPPPTTITTLNTMTNMLTIIPSIVDIANKYNLENMASLGDATFVDSISMRQTILVELKSFIGRQCFNLPSVDISLSNELVLLQGSFSAFVVYIYKCLYELQIKNLI